MKKTKFILLIILLLGIVNVKAAEYKEKELIDAGSHVTVTTDSFKYIDIYYDSSLSKVVFTKIRNLKTEEIPVTVSIGLFDSNKKNIGTINYCDNTTKILPDNNIAYSIQVDKKYISKSNSLKDIKYISILSENNNCNTGHSLDFVGQTVDEIGLPKNTEIDNDSKLFLEILGIVVGVVVFVFLYNFMFTNKYSNMNGDDTREAYKTINKNLERQREYDAINNPPKPKEVKKNKTDEVIAQEEQEKENNTSDLQDFYK